jgi:hypothetical protein
VTRAESGLETPQPAVDYFRRNYPHNEGNYFLARPPDMNGNPPDHASGRILHQAYAPAGL